MDEKDDDRRLNEALARADKQYAAYTSWAVTADRTARTEPGRRAALARFENQVDPDRVMTPTARAQAAEAARRAFYVRLSTLGVKARKAKGSRRR